MNITDILSGNKPNTKAKELNTGEVFALWEHLVKRYDVYEMTDIFENFSYDKDFQSVLKLGRNLLENEITEMENMMNRYGIPLPPRPPKSINTPANTEVLRDELMFRLVYMGIQNFLTAHIRSILNSNDETLLDMYEKFLRNEIDVFRKLKAYGKVKGWQFIPPAYKSGSS